MPHKYQSVFGWTDFQDIYEEMVDKYDNCVFIELGSFQGKSAVLMGELIKEKEKNIKLICVDLFPTKDELNIFRDIGAGQGDALSGEGKIINDLPKSLLDTFVENIRGAGVDDVIIPIKSDSDKAANLLSTLIDTMHTNSPVKFIFVDARHDYLGVKKDIDNWIKLIAVDGVIAGHDYESDGVNRAVNDYFADTPYKVVKRGASWFVEL